MRLRSPSGRKRGIRKQEIPPSAWARMRNASHIGAERNHLWPVTSYSAPGPPPFSGRAVVVLARTSEPPCFSVIPIPHSAPFLSTAGDEPLVVGEGEEPRLPLGGQLGLLADRRDHRVGHRDRAHHAGLDLGQEHRAGRSRHVGAWAGLQPGVGVDGVGDADLHHLVPRRVELDLVDPVAEAVVGSERGLVDVREAAQLDHVRAPALRAKPAQPLGRPVGPLPRRSPRAGPCPPRRRCSPRAGEPG